MDTRLAFLNSLPPLHPDRIVFALEVMSDVYAKQMLPKDPCTETVLCVLRQTHRAQQAIGLTSGVADAGVMITSVAQAVSKIIKRSV